MRLQHWLLLMLVGLMLTACSGESLERFESQDVFGAKYAFEYPGGWRVEGDAQLATLQLYSSDNVNATTLSQAIEPGQLGVLVNIVNKELAGGLVSVTTIKPNATSIAWSFAQNIINSDPSIVITEASQRFDQYGMGYARIPGTGPLGEILILSTDKGDAFAVVMAQMAPGETATHEKMLVSILRSLTYRLPATPTPEIIETPTVAN